MSSKDTKTKQYTKDPRIFADAFNQYLYQGEEIIKAKDLQEMDAAEIVYIAGDEKKAFSRQKQRDVKKRWVCKRDKKNVYCLLAIENQSDIHYAMPLKAALYDVMQLEEQRRVIEVKRHRELNLSGSEFISGFGKDDRLIPIVTLVIYYGADEWDAPRSIREMYTECNEKLLGYVIDYKINLIAPYHMEEGELGQFHTSLRQVLTYIKYSTDKEKLKSCMERDKNFRNLDREAAEVIREMTNARFSLEEGKERVDMCLAEEQMIEEGREEGRAYSLVSCIESAIKNFHITLEAACEALGTTVDKYEESKALLK